MQPDTINAVGMILMAIFSVGVICVFKVKSLKNVSWGTRVPSAIGVCVLALIVISMHTQRCIELPAPFGQFELTALLLILIVTLVDNKFIVLISCVVLIFTGGKLERHFQDLVHYSNEYTTIDANTNRPMAKGCNDMKSAEGIVPEKFWHTWFTGIYGIKK
jgi:uncharacterized membrane protein YhaH (DUF805 family)